MPAALKTTLAALAGYLLSAVSSVVFFRVTGHSPHASQPAWFIALTVVYGVAFSLQAGYLAARVGGYNAGFAVAVITFTFAMLSALADAHSAHWSQVVALVAMCPAAVVGARLGRPGGF